MSSLSLLTLISLLAAFAYTYETVDSFHFQFINFTFTNKEDYASYVKDHSYQQVIPHTIRTYGHHIYVSLPRFTSFDTPATFALFNPSTELFIPFPCPEFNNATASPDNLQSVLGFEINPHDGWMWILDQGRKNESGQWISGPKIVVYDPINHLVRRVSRLPDSLLTSSTFLSDLVLDPVSLIVYFTDAGISKTGKEKAKGRLIKYVYEDDVFEVLVSDHQSTDSQDIWITIDNQKVFEEFPLNVGIHGIAMDCQFKTLYFSPLTSRDFFSFDLSSKKVKRLGNKKCSSDDLFVSSFNHLYLTDVDHSRLLKTDLYNDGKDIIKHQQSFFHSELWPSSIDVNNGKLYFISNQLHNFLSKKIDWDHDENFVLSIITLDNEQETSYLYGCFSQPFNFHLELIGSAFLIIALCIVGYFYFRNRAPVRIPGGYLRV
ncbi:hypothetical protein P9112_001761 [Eukaryota sp. TZLM1-RC]